MAEAKAAYRAAYEAWTRAKDAAGAAGAVVSTLVGRMLAEFEVRARGGFRCRRTQRSPGSPLFAHPSPPSAVNAPAPPVDESSPRGAAQGVMPGTAFLKLDER